MINYTDRIRIRKLDKNNLGVEILVDVKNKQGKIVHKWKLYGYYSTLKHAARGLVNAALDYDFVCNNEESINLTATLEKLEETTQRFVDKINSLDKSALIYNINI